MNNNINQDDTINNNTQPEHQNNQFTDFGFNKVHKNQKSNLVASVFDSVANNYDLMNDLMSLGLHRFWKRFTHLVANTKPNAKVLDIAGGTGDMTLGFKKILGDTGEVWHTDININMLKQGRNKLLNHSIITPECICDAEKLPFADNYFDIVCVSFGLRNMTNKLLALKEMHRVLKSGGELLVLEFSQVYKPFRKIYDFYSFNILPKIGKYIAKDEASYKYLAESIKMHPNQEALCQLITDAGFVNVNYHNLSFGITALHKAYKV